MQFCRHGLAWDFCPANEVKPILNWFCCDRHSNKYNHINVNHILYTRYNVGHQFLKLFHLSASKSSYSVGSHYSRSRCESAVYFYRASACNARRTRYSFTDFVLPFLLFKKIFGEFRKVEDDFRFFI